MGMSHTAFMCLECVRLTHTLRHPLCEPESSRPIIPQGGNQGSRKEAIELAYTQEVSEREIRFKPDQPIAQSLSSSHLDSFSGAGCILVPDGSTWEEDRGTSKL